jgi:AraC family transcriptional regulator of adaptative response/methylated-DNA-[protein]-cysteine methyltransferase
VIDAAFESGYGSLRGFTESFKKTTGFPPSRSRDLVLVKMTRILTPLGPMLAGATEEGICLLEFADRRMLETELARLKRQLRAEPVPGSSKHFEALHKEIAEYFDGMRKEFSLPLVLRGTPFQQKVWTALRTIPYGGTRTYEEQAKMLGNPRAVRAVARANGANRIAIIIPCHRVVGKDGRLTGYGGGLWRKQYLLARIIHKPCREVAEVPVMARKTSEATGGVFEGYAEDRQARMTPAALAHTTPQQRACE